MFFGVQKKGQLVPNMGKHRAKQELETVPPQELGTVPPQGPKKGLWGGTVSNYPVGLFLTLDLLLAAVRVIFFMWYCSWLLKRQKSGAKNNSPAYICVCEIFGPRRFTWCLTSFLERMLSSENDGQIGSAPIKRMEAMPPGPSCGELLCFFCFCRWYEGFSVFCLALGLAHGRCLASKGFPEFLSWLAWGVCSCWWLPRFVRRWLRGAFLRPPSALD